MSRNSIGERVKFLRTELLILNQKGFADKLKISRTLISNLETGDRNVTDRTIYDICREFNINEKWLRYGEGEVFINISKMEKLNSIGTRIKYLRKNVLKLTQVNFATKIKLARNSIAQMESDRWNITDRTINDISKEFKVNKEWLLTGQGDIFIDIKQDEAIIDWATEIAYSDNQFKKDYLYMLSNLADADWHTLEKMTTFILKQDKG